MINREDRLSLLFNSFKGDKGMMEKSMKVLDACNARFDQVNLSLTFAEKIQLI